MAKKQKRKLTRKQKLAGFGGKRAQSAAKASRRSAPVKRKTTKKTTKKKKKVTSQTNWGATAAAGIGGLLAGGAAGYFTHDQVQGLLQNLANGDVPVLSGLAGLVAGQGNGLQISQGEQMQNDILVFQQGIPAPALAPTAGTQQLMTSLYSGLAQEALAAGKAQVYQGEKDQYGFPVGIYPQDTPFWAKQEALGTI